MWNETHLLEMRLNASCSSYPVLICTLILRQTLSFHSPQIQLSLGFPICLAQRSTSSPPLSLVIGNNREQGPYSIVLDDGLHYSQPAQQLACLLIPLAECMRRLTNKRIIVRHMNSYNMFVFSSITLLWTLSTDRNSDLRINCI